MTDTAAAIQVSHTDQNELAVCVCITSLKILKFTVVSKHEANFQNCQTNIDLIYSMNIYNMTTKVPDVVRAV